MAFIVGTISAPINADTRPFQSGLNQAHNMGINFISGITRSMQGIGQSMTQFGAMLTKSITVPLAAAAVSVFKFGKDFEYELSKVTGLVGISQKQVNAWGKDIIAMSPALGKPPRELADALFFVTSAGIKGTEAMDVLKMSAKASAAGLGETKVVADLVTSAMNAYGSENLSATKATDILVSAVREGKAEASELASSMGQVLPLASEMGVTFDQVAAAQAAMTRTGTGASEAATQLKGILSSLIKPSKQAQDQLAAMGTNASEMRKKIREEGLLKALMDLRQMTNKYGEEAMARVFPNIRALMGALDLMGENLEDNQKIFENVADSTGILDDAFKAASDTTQFKWNAALAQIQSTSIKFFDILKISLVPILEKFTDILGFVADKLASLPIKQQQVIIGFAAIAAVIGPALIIIGTLFTSLVSIIGGFITSIMTIGTVISAIGLPALGAVAALLPIIAGYITFVIGTIAAWIASFVYLFKTNKEFHDKVLNTWDSIKNNAIIIFEEIKKTAIFAIEKIKEFWQKYGDTILSYVQTMWGIILNVITIAVELIKDAIKIGLAIIRGDWETVLETIKELTSKIFNEIKERIENKLTEIKDKIIEKYAEIKEDIKIKLIEWKNAIINKLIEIKESIVNKLLEWKTSIIEWFTKMPETIKQKLVSWKNAIIKWFEEQHAENMRQYGIWSKNIKEWFNSMPEKLRTHLEKWKVAIKKKYDEIKESIKTKLNEWYGTIKNWFESRPEKIRKFLNDWKKSIKDKFEEIKESIITKLNGWWKEIKNWFNGLPKKKEVKTAGRNVINKMIEGTKEKKEDFIDKLGKIIVDVAKGAIIFAGIALMAAGREICKRIIKSIKNVDFKQIGRNIVSSIISGIKDMFYSLGSTAAAAAGIIASHLPHSPAKVGPLKDLDKLNFAGPIIQSLHRAEEAIKKSFLGDIMISGMNDKRLAGLSTPSYTNTGTTFTGNNFNFHGIQDIVAFMDEMQNVIKRYGGKFYA